MPASWGNLEKVTVESDFDVTIHLKRRQPALPALLASGCTPIYPCHVPTAEMRRKPIGTGPFKLAEFHPDVTLFEGYACRCWQPWVKNLTIQSNSIYNGWRFEDIWLDR